MMCKLLALSVLVFSTIGEGMACAQQEPGRSRPRGHSVRPSIQRLEHSQSGRLLVLKNGQVIRGQIHRDVESVQVQTDGGSRLVILAEQVDFVTETLEQAYWQKSARTRATDLQGQIDLFYWCLRNQLMRQAQNQIDVLQEMSIKATKLEFLDRQLRVALQAQRRAAAGQHAQADPSRFSTGPTRLEGNGGVRQVAYEMDAATARDFQRLERIKRMEREIDELPDGAVAMFKRQVEPTLVRACFDCHGSDDPTMPLWRMGRNQVIPRTMSQRNLQSVLQQIRGGDPAGSPLWVAATQPHGENAGPLLKPGTPAYNHLAQWVQWMALQKPASQNVRLKSTPAVRTRMAAPSASSPVRAEPKEPDMAPPTIPTLQPRRLPKAASPDPFDPTEFNEKYRARASRAKSAGGEGSAKANPVEKR